MHSFKLQKKVNLDKNLDIHFYRGLLDLEVIYLKTNDLESVFTASFNTLPTNNKGIPHILEHMVLCGSKKYPIEDPFNELLSSTMHTYLNAITYKDKTIYPLASKNIKEFDKMFKVYIDAVFAPNLTYKAFMQEGIRFEDNEYNGIAYNEMKNAYSDVDTILQQLLYENIFFNNNMKFDSAGIPKEIEKLNYNEVIDYYDQYYVKSNCTLIFYGNLDIDYYLSYIENNYLLQNNTCMKNSNIIGRNSLEVKEETEKFKTYYYENLEENNIIIGIYFDISENYTNIYNINILIEYLLSTNESPLMEFLLDTYDTICITYDLEVDILNPILTINLKTEIEVKLDVEEVYCEIINFLKNKNLNKLNKVEINSVINKIDFDLKDEDYGYKPKGLFYSIELLRMYSHTKKRNTPILGHLVELKNDNIFEDLNFILEKEFINSSNYFGINLYNIECEKNNSIKPLPLEDLIIDNELEFTVTYDNDIKILNYENNNKNISYYTLVFDIGEINLNAIGLYIDLVGELSTNEYDIKKLNIMFNNYIGDMNVSYDCCEKLGVVHNYLLVEVKIKNNNITESINIVEEIIRHSIFENNEIINQVINESKVRIKEDLESSNYDLSIIECLKNIKGTFYNKSQVEGLDYYEYLKKYDNKNIGNYISDLQKTIESINYTNLEFISISSSKENLITIKDELIKSINKNKNKDKSLKIKYRSKNTTDSIVTQKKYLVINSDVNTNVRGLVVSEAFDEYYKGVSLVFSNIIKNLYLSDNLRIKGGAYGYEFCILKENIIYMLSYNDKNIDNTYEVFNNVFKFIDELSITQDTLHKYIISTLNEVEYYKNTYDKYIESTTKYLYGIELEEVIKLKQEIIKVDVLTLKGYANKLKNNILYESNLTVGNNRKINDSRFINKND